MRWKQIEDEPNVFALIFETGDEIASVLQQFARRQELAGSSFKAIGALSYAKLGWFNWETKKYDPACVLDELWNCFRSFEYSGEDDRSFRLNVTYYSG